MPPRPENSSAYSSVASTNPIATANGNSTKLRRANIDASAGSVEEVARIVAQIRERWPEVRILLRADSGITRDELMTWCEQNDIDYLFGLAKNNRLIAEIAAELAERPRRTARAASQPGASRTSVTGRARAGAGNAASSARPSG